MGFIQDITLLPVVGVIKTLHYIERVGMELSEEKTNTVQDGVEQVSHKSNPSCTITDVTEIDLAELDDEIQNEGNFHDGEGNLRISTNCYSQGSSRRSSICDSEGNSQSSSIFDSQKSSRRPSQYGLNDTLENSLDEQLLLEADFFIKAFPRRALPSYVTDNFSDNVQRQRKSTDGF